MAIVAALFPFQRLAQEKVAAKRALASGSAFNSDLFHLRIVPGLTLEASRLSSIVQCSTGRFSENLEAPQAPDWPAS